MHNIIIEFPKRRYHTKNPYTELMWLFMDKTQYLICGLTMAISLVVNPSIATKNSINILGEIADETCQIRINDTTPVVPLPTVPQEDLAIRAETAGRTSFIISVYDCPLPPPCGANILPPILDPEQPPAIVMPGEAPPSGQLRHDLDIDDEFDIEHCGVNESPVPISVVFRGNNVTSSGNLGNTSGTAKNVEIQILDMDGTAVNLSTPFKQKVGDSGDGGNVFDSHWQAQYYASGSSTAGTVQASLQYSISYQ
ncbi:TPA: type 1 fimbrial protein [Klebsiella oxytoca]|nr:type 1 fimbrial protein [Klebsiella oxytoca]